MKYFEPNSIGEALETLESNDDVQCMAGGQTLIAMMNSGLLAPEALMNLQHIEELKGISIDGSTLRIGAMTTHAEIANATQLTGALFVIQDAARQIAHPAIRSVGTIGGSICVADPAADFPAALLSADARVEIRSPAVDRQISITDFFVDYYETSLQPGEMVTALLLPMIHQDADAIHLKVTRVEGDFATISISLVLSLEGPQCTYARVAVGSAGPVPLHEDEADKLLINSDLNSEVIAKAGEVLVRASDPVDDVRGSSDYRRMLIKRLLNRAIKALQERKNG